MEYKTIAGVKIPSIGLGTYGYGGGWLRADHSKDQEQIGILKEAIAMGYTHIDTAEAYGAGHSEELIGKAIEGTDRKKLFIVTKVYSHLKHDDVLKACKGSLERLGTGYIDLYLIHAPNLSIPIKETMQAMNELVDQGMVKHLGVSNFSVEEMEEAQQHSKHKIVCNQVEYNLSTRNIGRSYGQSGVETEVLPYCQQNGIIFMAYSPLDKGLLKGPQPLIDRVAKKHGKTRIQVALNWLISKENVVAIPKASKLEHLKENLGAASWRLDAEDMKQLDLMDVKHP